MTTDENEQEPASELAAQPPEPVVPAPEPEAAAAPPPEADPVAEAPALEAAAPPAAEAPAAAATDAPAVADATSPPAASPVAPAAGRPAGDRPMGDRPPRRDDGDGPPDRRKRHFGRRRVCAFCADKVTSIDYKDSMRLRRFLSDRARIEPRRKTGTCAKHQRWLATALKRARHLAMLPYTPEHIRTSGISTGRGR